MGSSDGCSVNWIKVLPQIRSCSTTLYDLPNDREEIYTHVLAGIKEEYRKDACTALRWLSLPKDLLKQVELCEP